jgi:hypothetical protein
MSRGFSVNRMSAALAIIAACPLVAMAAGTIRVDDPSTQSFGASCGAADSNKAREARPHDVEDGSVADTVEVAKPAVFSVRVRYRAAAGERGASAPLDQSRNPPGQPLQRSRGCGLLKARASSSSQLMVMQLPTATSQQQARAWSSLPTTGRAIEPKSSLSIRRLTLHSSRSTAATALPMSSLPTRRPASATVYLPSAIRLGSAAQSPQGSSRPVSALSPRKRAPTRTYMRT